MFKDSLLEHVDELRVRVIKVFLAWICCFVAAYPFMDILFSFLIQPVGKVIFTSPASAFMAELKLAFLVSFLAASPIIFYQVWQFISVGLKASEQKYIRFFGPFSLICFLGGAFFAYGVAIPFSMRFLLGFASDVVVPMITIENYLSFLMSMVLAFGCLFEMPLVLIFLTAIGVATPAFMIQKRKHAIVLLLILSALITPPDIVSMFIMTGPLVILYEIGIIAAKITYQRKFEVEAK